jgi:hypothetical protein
LGLAVGSFGTYYWMTQHPRNESPEKPALRGKEKETDQAIIPAPEKPGGPQLQRATLLAEDVSYASGVRSAASFTLRGVDAAYYWVIENNSYRNGSSYVRSGKGLIRDGARITVAVMDDQFRVPGEGVSISGAVSVSHSQPGQYSASRNPFLLGLQDFVPGGATRSEWALDKAVDVRIGQVVTLYQFGCVDQRTGSTDDTPLQLLNDPHGEFKPLPRIGDGHNHAERLTVRLLFMARKGEHLDFPKDPEEFVDVAGFLKRAAAKQK